MTTPSTPSPVPDAARRELAPGGTLRAGINFGNPILAQRDPAGGPPRGVAIELAHELGRRLGARVELVTYDGIAPMVDAAKTGAWDIAFLGADPARAGEIGFTAPYLELEATYLVPATSALRAAAEVDRDGVRVAAPARAAYELFLSRSLKRATLVRAPSPEEAVELFKSGQVEALAGLTQALVSIQTEIPGSRIVEGRFMAVQQAVGTPRGRDAGLAYLRQFVEEAKASGFVANAIARGGFRGVTVAPPAA